jgi:hypothetical protein
VRRRGPAGPLPLALSARGERERLDAPAESSAASVARFGFLVIPAMQRVRPEATGVPFLSNSTWTGGFHLLSFSAPSRSVDGVDLRADEHEEGAQPEPKQHTTIEASAP